MTHRFWPLATIVAALAAGGLFLTGCGDDAPADKPDPNAYLEKIADRLQGAASDEETRSAVQDLGGLLGRLEADSQRDTSSPENPLEIKPLRRVVDLLIDGDPDVVDPDVFLQCALSLHAVSTDTLQALDSAREGKTDSEAYLPLYASAHVALTSKDPSTLQRFEQAAAARPNHAEARFFLAQMLILAGRPTDALAELDAAIQVGYDLTRGEYHRAVLLTRMGRVDEALPVFRSIGLQKNHYSGKAWNQAGKILADRGDLDGAEDSFRAGVRHEPNSAPACYNLGRILYDQGSLEEATEQLGRAASLRTSDPRAPTLLGRIAEDNGDDAEAEARYREAIRLLPPGSTAEDNSPPPEPIRRLESLLRRTNRPSEIESLKAQLTPP